MTAATRATRSDSDPNTHEPNPARWSQRLPIRPTGYAELRHIPGRRGLPWLGTTRAFLRDYLGFVNGMVSQYGPVYRNYGLGVHVIGLIGADFNKRILMNRGSVNSSELGWWPFLGGLFDNGLMLRDGAAHRHHRKLLTGAFTSNALEGDFERLVHRVDTQLDAAPTGRFLAYPWLKQLTLDVANDIFLGLAPGPESAAVSADFVATVRASMSLIRRPVPGTLYGRGRRGRARLVRRFQALLDTRRDTTQSDILGRLCAAKDEHGARFSDPEIIDHLLFLMMAAHDTTACAITALVYELGHRSALQDELRALCRAHPNPDLETLMGLDRLTWTIQEVLRLRPPVPTIPRRTVVDLEFGGYAVPANTVVMIAPALTHRDPAIWDEPERFDPNRFSPERAEHKRVPFAYLPFGGGVHLCLGKRFAEVELQLLAYQLLTRFKWQHPPGYAPRYPYLPLPKPADGLPLVLERLTD